MSVADRDGARDGIDTTRLIVPGSANKIQAGVNQRRKIFWQVAGWVVTTAIGSSVAAGTGVSVSCSLGVCTVSFIVPVTVALGGKNPPAGDLARQGWNVVDAPSATLTPEIYRDFIAQSRGEISTAKNVYVALRTGWFSCRTACYLAAGRPAAVQDTGFSKILPVGNGLLAFETAEQARAAIETVEAGYMRHTVAARDFAAEYLDSGKVLSRLLSDIFSA